MEDCNTNVHCIKAEKYLILLKQLDCFIILSFFSLFISLLTQKYRSAVVSRELYWLAISSLPPPPTPTPIHSSSFHFGRAIEAKLIPQIKLYIYANACFHWLYFVCSVYMCYTIRTMASKLET